MKFYMVSYRYELHKEQYMNNIPMTYDEYIEWDMEYKYYEYLMEMNDE